MTDLGIVVTCDYDEDPGHPEIIEAEAVVLGSAGDGYVFVCGSERCAAQALIDIGAAQGNASIHPLGDGS